MSIGATDSGRVYVNGQQVSGPAPESRPAGPSEGSAFARRPTTTEATPNPHAEGDQVETGRRPHQRRVAGAGIATAGVAGAFARGSGTVGVSPRRRQ